jgi:tetratricopeptide (TPR) repeat protein
MQPDDTAGGLSHLIKVALPRVGQVGAVASGIIGLMVALQKLSGEIVTAVEGIVLLTALVATATVIWGYSNKSVAGKSIRLPLYNQRTRYIAGVVLALLAVLTVLLTVRVTNEFLASQSIDQTATGPRGTPRPGVQLTRQSERSTLTPGALATASGTPLPDLRQINDVRALNSLGFQAVASADITRALTIFTRALQVDATSPMAQLGYGEALYFAGRYPEAMNALKTALQLNANLSDAHAYLGLVYAGQKDAVRARAEFDEFLRVAPTDSDLRGPVTTAIKQLPNVTPIAPPPLRATPAPTR